MFEKFGQSAIRVVMLANEEARRLHLDKVSSELILLGIIGESLSHAAAVLRNSGIDIARAREYAKERLARAPGMLPVELPLTDEAKQLLRQSWEQAKRTGLCEISPDHILLAIIQEGEGVAFEMLSDLGADSATLRAQVLMAIDAAPPSIYIPVASVPNAINKYAVKPSPLISLAQEESRRLGHHFIGTEQILLAMLRDRRGLPAIALKRAGVSYKKALVETEKIIGRGRGFVAVETPFTPRAKRVLELAWAEARQLGHNYIIDAHVLLGLLQEDEGVAAKVLHKLGVRVPELRQAILKSLAEGASVDKQT